jgi:hypothetical protein
MEGSQGLDLSKYGKILVSEVDKIFIIDAETFEMNEKD